MRSVSLRKPLFAVSVVLALVPLLLSAAPPETAKSKPQPSPADKVRSDLDQTISVSSLDRMTLKDVLAHLSDKQKLKFDVDDRAFADVGIKDVLTFEVSMPELKDVKVKEVLRRLLKQVPVAPSEATYVIVGDTVVITTEAQAPYQWMRQLVNLDVEKEELSSVVKKLARATGTNLVIDARAAKEAQTLVTLQVQDASLESVVYVLADMVGLQPVRVGNMLYITTKTNVMEMRDDPERARVIGPCPLPPQYGGPGQIGQPPP
jgi:hypothetical protein